MSMQQVLWRGAGCGFLVLTVALMMAGCEKAEGLVGLTLAPESVIMGPDEHSVAITVVGETANDPLALPLEWRVSDPALGTIEHSGGVTAIYRRTGQLGLNTVTASDPFKNEGFCVIEQVPAAYVIALMANPESPIAMGTATTISITMTEGIKPPYNWELLSGPGEVSAGSGSASAVYSSSIPGVGVIRVTDGNGVQGVISIVTS